MELQKIYDGLLILIEKELKLRGYKNNDIKMTKGTTTGDNYLSIIALIDINSSTAEGKPEILHWIAKCAHQNKQFREQIKVDFVFSREVYIYTKVFPTFEDLQRQRGLSQLFKPYPKFITSSLEDMNETIVMENLKANGYLMKNRREPLDYVHTKYVLTNYAKFHALSIALKDQNFEKFQELTENLKNNFFDDKCMEAMQPTLAATFTRALKCFTEDNEKELKLLRYLEKNACDVLTYSCNRDVVGNCEVIIHGDSWNNNILFKYENPDEPHIPKEMVLLDFQLTRMGSPAADLTYFLYTCTDGELRKKYYEELLNHYYTVFSDFLKELGSDPQKLFPHKVFLDHMRRFSAYGIFMSMMVLHLMLSDADEIPDVSEDELDMEAWKYETRNVTVYLARAKDIIQDAIKYNYDLYTKE